MEGGGGGGGGEEEGGGRFCERGIFKVCGDDKADIGINIYSIYTPERI